MELKIQVNGADQVARDLAEAFSPEQTARAIQEAGFNCQNLTADHVAKASKDRHKTADRLGAAHTKYLEFAPGRTRSFGAGPNKGFMETKDASMTGITIVIGNTEGLKRAYGPLTIKPRNAKYLTIPEHADAYGRRARDFENLGRKLACVHTGGGHLALFEKTEGGKSVRMYSLVKSVTLPQDAGLLPTDADYAKWGAESLEALMESYRSMERRRRARNAGAGGH